MSVIGLRDMHRTYRRGEVEVHALRGVSLGIEEGELISVMGPSGSGKSTLMNVICCSDKGTSGDYFLDGTDVQDLNDDELADVRNRNVGFVFQTYNLLPRTTAQDNVEVPLIYAGAKNRRDRARSALEMVGLADRTRHHPNELSGGEQQRVAIARPLASNPAIILADEPTGNLDTKTGLEIVSIFQRLNSEQGITIVYVTNDAGIAAFTRRVVHLRDGSIEGNKAVNGPRDAQEELSGL